MRLIFVNRFFYPDESATSLMLTDLIEGLAPVGPEMHVITASSSYTPEVERKAEEALPDRLSVTRLPTLPISNRSLAGRVLNFLAFYLALLVVGLRQIRRGDIVVCLTDPPLVGVVAVIVARLKRAQVVHWVQDIYPEVAIRLGYGSPDSAVLSFFAKIRDWAWKNAAFNVAIGERMKAMLVSHGVSPDRVRVIQNWAAEDALAPIAPEANPLRLEWGFNADTLVIGYSGNLGRAHDAETMLDAGSLLADKRAAAFNLLFIGGGVKHKLLDDTSDPRLAAMIERRDYRPRRELALSLNVPDVHWLSLEPELEGLIVPSKFYGAAAVGKPIVFIGDTSGEVARLIDEADCGASFAKGDAQGVAAYLASLAADPALRQRLGANARAYCLQQLSRSARMNQWRGLIREIALEGALSPEQAGMLQGSWIGRGEDLGKGAQRPATTGGLRDG